MLKLDILSRDLKKRRSPLRKSSYGIISGIYGFLCRPSEQTRAAMIEWESMFRFLYGDGNARRSGNVRLRAEKLLEDHSIAPDGGGTEKAVRLLIFSVQTYYSLLVKYIMKDILCGIRVNSGTEVFSHSDIILGSFARRYGIANYVEPDMYCWPLYELENGFGAIMDSICADVERYSGGNPEYTQACLPAGNDACDYIRRIYEALLPRELRHSLGEYYTPDWLAELTLDTALGFYNGKDIKDLFIADPTCGSGTFLIRAIAKKKLAGCGTDDIIKTTAGIDINPLAVLTAKTNYLIMLGDMPEREDTISLPVYRADILSVFSGKDGSADCAAVRALEKRADIVIGNPPWVNWEYLPEPYRRGTEDLWTEYGLFSAKGRERSFAKEDVSALIAYTVIDRMLADGGVIGFVMKQSIFKSEKNGAAFRRFSVRGVPVGVLRADDLSGLSIFGGAMNRAALLFAEKGRRTVYPVPYFLWRGKQGTDRRTFGTYSRLSVVLGSTEVTEQSAIPSVRDDPASPWSTAIPGCAGSFERVLGSNPYRARTGVFTGGANAVYYLKINSSDGDLVSVTNITDRAKRKLPQVTARLEKEFVYPLLRGGNVSRWKTSYDTYILCPHTAGTRMMPVSQDKLRSSAPLTMSYLESFRTALDERKGFAGWEKKIQEKEFHAVLRIGEYTFSPYKVVWRYIADDFICAVICGADDPYLGIKPVLPNEKLMFISAGSAAEAYYLCGILSSTPVSRCVRSFMSVTSISAHVLDKLYIPAFDPSDVRHNKISELCRDGHINGDIDGHISSIDIIARDIYGTF